MTALAIPRLPSLPIGTKVLLDSMLFIYLFDNDPRFTSSVTPLFDRIESGSIIAMTSMITPLEVLSAPVLERQKDKIGIFVQFFQQTPHLSVYPLTWEIMEEAAQLRRQFHSLKTPDSIQLATGIIKQAKFFITNDKRLSRLSHPSITIVALENK